MNRILEVKYSIKRCLGIFFITLMLPMLAACKDDANAPVKTAIEPIPKMGTRVALALTGFNYTNRYIDQFSAGAQDGGNLFISSPKGGGGGSVCCIPYFIGASAWKTKIRWQVGACTYNNRTDTDGERLFEIYHYFKEAVVQIDNNIPKRPRYFEVHFYPDGHVEAAITENTSRPRLLLDENREDNSPYRQCPNDKRPEE